MDAADVHGPVDFVLIEFTADRLTGRAAEALLDLADAGIIALYDVLVLGKRDDGSSYVVELTDADEVLGDFAKLEWVRSGLLTEEDVRTAAETMQAGTLAVVIVYENTWAIPFVAAARASGGELIAGGRIPAQDVIDALDATEDSASAQAVPTMTSGA